MKKYEIIDVIDNVDVITEEVYEDLVSKYDKKLVDTIIDSQIDEDNLKKFQFYLDMKNEEYQRVYVGIYKQYINEIQKYKKFDNVDNRKYLLMIANIKKELSNIFKVNGFDMRHLSIIEQINLFLNTNNDNESLVKVRELASKYIDLRNKLIVGNLSLVVASARPFLNLDVDKLELIQNGNDGLITAIDKYNVSMNTKFSTYAYFWIEREMIQWLKRNNTLFSAPSYFLDYNSSRVRIIKELSETLGREPSDLEVAQKMGVSIKKYEQIKTTFEEVLSLSDLIEMEEKDDASVDFLIDIESDLLEIYIDKEKKIEILKKIKLCLTDEEYYVIAKRYGLEGYELATYQEIGKMLEMSRSNVALIEKRALQKMRKKCKNLVVYW